jgi:hypothetical protein
MENQIMKRTFLALSLLILLLTSCGDKPRTILFNSESFAFSIENGWEINATVNVKGFEQVEKGNNSLFFTNLSYSVNLYTPNDTIYNADYNSIIDSTTEKIMDKQIESQFELDSNFTAGNYMVEFIVEDKYSNTKDTLTSKLILE